MDCRATVRVELVDAVPTFAEVVIESTDRAVRHAAWPMLDRPVAYNPRKHAPGSKDAGVSAHIIVTRYLKELGLKHSDTTAASVRRWRVATTWRESGLPMAVEVAGLSERDTIRLAAPEPTAHIAIVRYAEDDDF